MINSLKRLLPFAFVLAYLGIAILLGGCVKGGGGAMRYTDGQLMSVPQSEPHGILEVSREIKLGLSPITPDGDSLLNALGEGYQSILVKVDGKDVFYEIEGTSATFRLAPGKHEVEADYLASGSGYIKKSPVLKDVVEVKEKETASIRVFSDGKKIGLRIFPSPRTAGSVHGVLTYKETGTPIKNETISMLKVISTPGGMVTLEVARSGGGKNLGNITTKTDGDGVFRFDDVEKGTPYVLGAVDTTGKTVVVILSADDKVKDLGIVYQKKESEKLKVAQKAERLATVKRPPQKGVTPVVRTRPSESADREIRKDGRFIAYNNGTIMDTWTTLMWAAKDNGSDINWANAKSYCANYHGGGYADWRMPTQSELARLYDEKKSRPGACNRSHSIHVATELIDITCFIPWTSETRGSDAAYFNFGNGERYWGPQDYNGNKRALPVRSGR